VKRNPPPNQIDWRIALRCICQPVFGSQGLGCIGTIITVLQFPCRNLRRKRMTKYLALATGAALAVAAASYSYAQTPPGTDRPAGEEGATSAKPNPDKKGPATKGATGTPKANPTPPGTDRPAGEEGTTSAKPNPDKK
jgi:hypothetical protein